MTVRNLYMNVKLTSAVHALGDITEISISESMAQMSASAEIISTFAHPFFTPIGTLVDIDIGYADEHSVCIKGGLVKHFVTRKPEFNHAYTVHDVLVKAMDNFIASDTPDTPYKATNIAAENLVGYLLTQSQITGYTVNFTGFTFGSVTPVPINLVGAGDYIENINRITGFTTWADPVTGVVNFTTRKPYIVSGDEFQIAHTFAGGNDGDILGIEYAKSDEKLRNRIVVYGRPGVAANASASSPYLPAGYFKTIVVAHELIDQQVDAQASANLNLTMFNRLTETVKLRAKGIPSIHARSIVAVSDGYTGLSSGTLWVVFAAKHTISKAGYSMELTLVR